MKIEIAFLVRFLQNFEEKNFNVGLHVFVDSPRLRGRPAMVDSDQGGAPIGSVRSPVYNQDKVQQVREGLGRSHGNDFRDRFSIRSNFRRAWIQYFDDRS